MTKLREQWISKVYRGQDPFSGFPRGAYAVDTQGWNSNHPKLIEAASAYDPCVLVEIGVWKGASVINMARQMKAANINGVVVAIDTWLGSAEHWAITEFFPHLALDHGRPTLMQKFMANVIDADVVDYVLPLPLDSLNASHLFKVWKLGADVIHLDAAHEYEPVLADIKGWWPHLRPGGIFIGDDYSPTGGWEGVRQAFDEAFQAPGMPPFNHLNGKCWITKPSD